VVEQLGEQAPEVGAFAEDLQRLLPKRDRLGGTAQGQQRGVGVEAALGQAAVVLWYGRVIADQLLNEHQISPVRYQSFGRTVRLLQQDDSCPRDNIGLFVENKFA
jgi:hypothetical protein